MIQRQQKTNRNNPSRARALVAASAVTAAALLSPLTATAQLKINEAMIDGPGTNPTQDFLELIGTPNTTVNNVWLLFVEGDTGAAGGVGQIDHALNLGTVTTGANGLFLRHNFSAVPTFDAGTTVTNGAFPGHENTAITWMVVTDFSGTAGAGGTDIDTNDDGAVDVTPWTSVLDSVGIVDGNVEADKLYGTPYGNAEFNQNAYTDTSAAVFRDTNSLMHGVVVTGTSGGPYTVSSGFTADTGYVLTPGSPNTQPASNPQAFRGAAGSSWNAGANWNGGVAPTAAGSVAMFDLTSGPASVSVTADATVGVLSFTNGGNRTITAGGGTLTLQGSGTNNAQVMVQFGNVTIGAPVKLGATTNFRPARGTTLTLTNLDGNGQNVNKNSIGTVAINSATPGQGLALGTLNVSSGAIAFPSDGSKNRALVTNSLVMSGTTSRIDISDNKLITNTPVGTSNGVIYSDVSGMVQKGFALGAWSGQGIAIRTSQAAALTGLTNIGVMSAAQKFNIAADGTATFAGQTVTGAATLVMYTYGGDANLDGFVSGDDYSAIDFAIATPGAGGWANGDFNWDGFISGDDYSVIDFNIVAQGTPFPTGANAGVSGVSAVPEPASLGLAGIGAAALLARRNRRRK